MVEGTTLAILGAVVVAFAILAIPILLHETPSGASFISALFDVEITNATDGEILVFDNGTWVNVAANFTGVGNVTGVAANLTDISFNAEEATVDDLTGTDCLNDVTVNFFNATDENQYRRQAIEMCADSDTDDNLTWLFEIPPAYNGSDFEFSLYWTDADSSAGMFTKRVIADSDDAEEHNVDGDMRIGSSDLELHEESVVESPPDINDMVGMRWTNVTVPQGAIITNATIQFHVDSTTPDVPIIVVFDGEDIDNAPTFNSTDFNISDRVGTSANVTWSIPDWVSTSDEGAAQLTPNLAPIVQEIVDRAGWSSGNSMVLMIRDWINNTSTANGERVAESHDGEPPSAPELSITFGTGAANLPVCLEFSLLALDDTEFMNEVFTDRQTVCRDKAGMDNLSITTFTVSPTDLEAEDLVMLRIHRPNDFVSDDFEGDIFLFGSALKWLS